MSNIYFYPTVSSYAHCPVEDMYFQPDFRHMALIAQSLGMHLEARVLEGGPVLVFGSKIAAAHYYSYYEGLAVSLKEFLQFQQSDEKLQQVQSLLEDFIRQVRVHPEIREELKNLAWEEVGVYFYTHT